MISKNVFNSESNPAAFALLLFFLTGWSHWQILPAAPNAPADFKVRWHGNSTTMISITRPNDKSFHVPSHLNAFVVLSV
jgi:hypothetical protein